ncbi:hypothetical protein [Ammoniphilus sp. CFH 90114]|uniref:hypothetical protein n=1 Tax=Ammoniphilus sp. CFH 90114 TaxID=2493665 RepID=UPI00100FB864|nr:hypothetical protein [Ammoniphilus sp. CFH 90114]RXT15101.1 hypothetical protein EIZ39_02515 [Ammoniphilus sp. CFH 90114]
MNLHSWKLLLPLLILLFIMMGCSPRLSTTVNPDMQEKTKVAVSTPMGDWSEDWEAIINNLKQITVITKEGWEVEIDKLSFANSFRKNPFKVKSTDPLSSMNYTVLIWSKSDEPSVLSVSSRGVEWNHDFYSNEEAIQFANYIREAVGQNFLKQLVMDRMMLSSNDLEQVKRLSDEKMAAFSDILRSSQFISGKPRLTYPLFPYYSLEIDAGGKEIVPVEILSPTLISVIQGDDKLYFQTEDSLLSALKDEIGMVDYSESHPKFLFKAKDVRVIEQSIPYNEQHYVMNKDKIDRFEATSLLHVLVRELSKGKRTDGEQDKVHKPQLTLEFVMEKDVRSVFIYDDFYIYQGRTFSKPDILKHLRNYIFEGQRFIIF